MHHRAVFTVVPLLIACLPAAAFAQCDPRQASCAPGYHVDISHPQGATCDACTGNTVSNGCTLYCSACPAGSVAGPNHASCVPNTGCTPMMIGSQLPSVNWSASLGKAGWYATQSALVNAGNGQAQGGQSYNQIKSAMGGSFANAAFTLVGGTGTGTNLPVGTYECQYNSPPFQHAGKTYIAVPAFLCEPGQPCLPP